MIITCHIESAAQFILHWIMAVRVALPADISSGSLDSWCVTMLINFGIISALVPFAGWMC